jgi:hypothetical protein
MKFNSYPFDTQVCGFTIESFRYTRKDINFQWKEKGGVEVSFEASIPSYALTDTLLLDCSQEYSNNMSFSCLQAQFLLERHLGYYIIQLFFPTTIVVVMSWMVMWVNPNHDVERISLLFLLVLTIMVQHSFLYQNLPPVSYIKAIDIWILICEFCVFFAIIGTIIEKHVLNQLASRSNAEHLQTRANRINLSNKIALPLCFILQVFVFGLLYK